jgi:hypothetical protein
MLSVAFLLLCQVSFRPIARPIPGRSYALFSLSVFSNKKRGYDSFYPRYAVLAPRHSAYFFYTEYQPSYFTQYCYVEGSNTDCRYEKCRYADSYCAYSI